LDIWDIDENSKFSTTPYVHLHGNSQSNLGYYGTALSERQLSQIKYLPIGRNQKYPKLSTFKFSTLTISCELQAKTWQIRILSDIKQICNLFALSRKRRFLANNITISNF
jgi:hypothetical protein